MKTIELQLSDNLNKKLQNVLNEEELSLNDYVNKIVTQELNSKHDYGNGFYYDSRKDKFYDSENKEIPLTKIQKNILLVLYANKNEIVSIEQIVKESWPKSKDVAIFTVRNMIKQIRDKTYKQIIVSHSSRGYSHGLVDKKNQYIYTI